MSRSGYDDDYEEPYQYVMWRGAVASAIRGKRGQAFLREMLDALDAMPKKSLIEGHLEAGGEYCALGAVAAQRWMDINDLAFEDESMWCRRFGIANALVRETMYENDEAGQIDETPEHRWHRMRAWVLGHIKS